MADLKISQLTAATTPLAGTETLPIVQSSTTKQVSVANLTAGRAISALSLSLTTDLAVADGGTGASDASTARTNLGLGTMSTQAASSVAITGGSVNGTTVGATTRATGSFTTLRANNNLIVENDTYIQAANPTGGDGGLKLYNTSNNTGSKVARFFGWDGSETGSISTYVNVTTYTTSSDSRLKENIGVATDASVIDNLIVRDFSWKANGQIDRGVFAQEAFLVKPSAVIEGNDDLTEHGTLAVPWSVDYSKYIPDIIVYCQQLKKTVTSQQDEIDALKQAVAALTAKVGG